MHSLSENILLFISGFGVVQAFLSSGLLFFHRRSDRSVTRFLALYIAFIPIPMIVPILQVFFPWQAILYIAPFTLLIGPFLYLYVQSFSEVITFKKCWPHFILFFVYLFILWRLSTTIGARYPPTRHIPGEVLHNPLTIIPISIRFLQMLAYYFLSRRSLREYQLSIAQLYSETSRINLNWVRLLLNGYLLLVVTTIALYSLVLRYPGYFNLFILIDAAAFTPYIYMATFKGVTQPTLWQIQPGKQKTEIERQLHDAQVVHEKIATIATDPTVPERERKTADRIIWLMEQEKFFREPQLSLQDLADRLELPAYQVSQNINDVLKKSFYDLVNGYRVEEAKRLLKQPASENFTILSVGFEAGFNSKTTFNTVFKKFTGYTPTEFRDKERIPVLINA